eukprot:Sspe_Gene.24817::Locus_9879_Transcript_2_2_Confidence_0.600_Length_1755::g.24817::m.24817
MDRLKSLVAQGVERLEREVDREKHQEVPSTANSESAEVGSAASDDNKASDGKSLREKDLEAQIQYAQQQLDLWREKNKLNKERIFSLEQKLQLSEEKYLKIQTKCRDLTNANTELERTLVMKTEAMHAECVQIEEKRRSREAELSQVKDELLQTAERADQEVRELKRRIAELEGLAERRGCDLRRMTEGMLEEMVGGMVNAAVATSLSTRLDCLMQEKEGLNASIVELKAKLDDASQLVAIERKKSNSIIKDLQTSLTNETAKVEELKAELFAQKTATEAAQAEVLLLKKGCAGSIKAKEPQQSRSSTPPASRGDAEMLEAKLLDTKAELHRVMDEIEAIRSDNKILHNDNAKKAAIIHQLMSSSSSRASISVHNIHEKSQDEHEETEQPPRERKITIGSKEITLPLRLPLRSSGGGEAGSSSTSATTSSSSSSAPAQPFEKQIRQNMQNVFEETLIKNIELQEHMAKMAEEIHKLQSEIRILRDSASSPPS